MSSPVMGRVKWFNNKSGYGFITATIDGVEKDVFVHHSAISVSSSQYKYLVQGEYVQFNLDRLAEGSSHEVQAMNVRGIQDGPLQCESRRQRMERRPVRDAPVSSGAPAPAAR
jgi:cold shock CspA family protein